MAQPLRPVGAAAHGFTPNAALSLPGARYKDQRMKPRVLAIATALATACAGSAQAGCASQFLRGKFMIPFDSFMAMTASSGEPCSKTFNSHGYMTFENIRIAVRPRHGSATASGGDYSIVYRSNPGFKGRDQFTVALSGSSRHGKRGTSNIRVEVAVD
jgi:hypothetical protein